MMTNASLRTVMSPATGMPGWARPHIKWNGRVALDAAGTCERGNVDGGCSCPEERLCGGACGGTGGENVVDKQDVFCPATADGSETLKAPRTLMAALPRREAGLAFGGAQTHECGRREGEVPAGMRLVQRVNGVTWRERGPG